MRQIRSQPHDSRSGPSIAVRVGNFYLLAGVWIHTVALSLDRLLRFAGPFLSAFAEGAEES